MVRLPYMYRSLLSGWVVRRSLRRTCLRVPPQHLPLQQTSSTPPQFWIDRILPPDVVFAFSFPKGTLVKHRQSSVKRISEMHSDKVVTVQHAMFKEKF